MSRIGKIPVEVPKDVNVVMNNGNVQLKGPKGQLDLSIPQGIKVEHKDNQLVITKLTNSKQDRANYGTIKARLLNMVIGVTKGHKKNLEIQGIGFRAQMQGDKITFNLGLSHPVEFEIPKSIQATVPTQTSISIEGTDIVEVGQVTANIRKLKPVEPYKGKGIRYAGEFVKRKQGKSVTK